MAEAILAFYATTSWSRFHSRRTKNNIHWIMQVVGSILSIAGCIVEYRDRRTHFRSIHSMTGKPTTDAKLLVNPSIPFFFCVGLISIVFLLISLLNGISALWAHELRKCVKPVYNKFFHNFVGIATFVIGELLF